MQSHEVSADNPAVLKRVSDGQLVRVTDPGEYLTATTTAGYQDVTEEKGVKPADSTPPDPGKQKAGS